MTSAQIIREIQALDAAGKDDVVRFVISMQGNQEDRQPEQKVDKRTAGERFLEKWAGAGVPGMTDEEIDQERFARLWEKHVK